MQCHFDHAEKSALMLIDTIISCVCYFIWKYIDLFLPTPVNDSKKLNNDTPFILFIYLILKY